MSRSNPNTGSRNPANRWFEWQGSTGNLKYYDKLREENIDVNPSGFKFLLLDVLATVKGWHDSSESGIYSNEVRNVTKEPLNVRAFKGGVLASGLYKDIKDTVKAVGGHYVQNCYIGYFDENDELVLGSIQFKGAALNAWIEFGKEHQNEIYDGAVQIDGYTEGKKGSITFRVPVFSIVEASEDLKDQAKELDKELQLYLNSYLANEPEVAYEPDTEEEEIPF